MADRSEQLTFDLEPGATSSAIGLKSSWGSGESKKSSIAGDEFVRLVNLHRAAWNPNHRLDPVRDLAPILGGMIGLDRSLYARLRSRDRIELHEKNGCRLLTNLIWEMAGPVDGVHGATEWADHLETTMAALPLVRVVDGAAAPGEPDEARPTMLWCVSNEPLRGRQLNLAGFQDVYNRLRSHWSAVAMEFAATDGRGRMTWPEARATIDAQRPTILVLVAHGSSSPRPPARDEPSVAFRSPVSDEAEWIPVKRVAQTLAGTRSAVLVILLCCDLTRSDGLYAGGRPATYSAAATMVEHGAPTVIAMQAPMHVLAAERFLNGFLRGWLTHFRAEKAAVGGRRDTVDGPEPEYAWLPTVFSSEPALTSTAMRDLAGRVRRASADASVLPDDQPSGLQRAQLVKALAKRLAGVGLLRLTAPVGTGATTLLGSALRALREEPGARPALYLDCSAPGPDAAVAARVVLWLGQIRHRYPVLFPPGRDGLRAAADIAAEPPDLLGRRVARIIDEAELTVVLDNLERPTDRDDRAFVESLAAEALHVRRGLIVLGGEPGGAAATLGDEFAVPVFGLDELEGLLAATAPELVEKTDDILRLTGGVPLVVRSLLTAYARRGWSAALATLNQSSIRYVGLLLSSLTEDATALLFRLAVSDRAIPVGSGAEHLFGGESAEAYNACIETGALRKHRADGEVWVRVPGHLREILLQLHAEDIENAAGDIVDDWLAKLVEPDNLADHRSRLQPLLAKNGGVEVAKYLAECFERAEEGDLALALALEILKPDGPPLKRLRFVRHASEWSKADDPHYADLHLLGANLAIQTGRTDEAQGFLDRIPDEADAKIRIAAKLARATWHKEARQHEGVDEAGRELDEALALIEADPGAGAGSRWAVQYERLRLALFFGRVPTEGLDALRDEVVGTARSDGQRSITLATLAEAAMKRGDGADWDRVSEWVVEASKLAEDPNVACDDRAYCAYQYARYLDHRAEDASEVIGQYKQVERLAEEQDDPARGALASFRRISLESQVYSKTPEEHRGEIEERLDRVDAALAMDADSALANRARVRLNGLGADLARMLGDAEGELEYLERGVQTAATRHLLAKSDLEWLLGLFARFLERAGALPRTFRRRQTLISAVRFTVEVRTEHIIGEALVLSLDRPERALGDIHAYRTRTGL